MRNQAKDKLKYNMMHELLREFDWYDYARLDIGEIFLVDRPITLYIQGMKL